MIGIIVSGRAVPTAASTEPTAPSASSSLRPNHSMPLVNSSAPSEDDDEGDDEDEQVHAQTPVKVAVTIADRDDDEDADRDADHRPFAGTTVPEAGDDDTDDGGRQHDEQAEPEEPVRSQGQDVGHDVAGSNAGPPLSGEIPAASIRTTPIDQQRHRDVGHRDQQPADDGLEVAGRDLGAALTRPPS